MTTTMTTRIMKSRKPFRIVPKGKAAEAGRTGRKSPISTDPDPNDRHFVLDHLTGAINFGDGIHGMIPPAGDDNIRMLLYRAGGGLSGNKPAGTITELKTSLPYVEKVTNPVAALGGADPESLETLAERVPHGFRHGLPKGERAVTPQDYEDLSRLASPAVARAHCVSMYDLTAPPQHQRRRDCVSLILVPWSADPEPVPDSVLKMQVRSFLDARRAPGAELVIVSPEYCRVGVAAEIVIESAEVAYKVELDVRSKLTSFLHPVTGGPEAKGWDFNRHPNRSDFYGLIEATPGVRYVRALEFDMEGGTGLLSVSSGQHRITLITE